MVLFLITPIYKENKWSRSFSKWFPRVVLPVLIMMFVSMGIRIRAYGFTENRYYVLILGLWIFAMMAYLSITKNKKNILLLISLSSVSYTHLDVYKRQISGNPNAEKSPLRFGTSRMHVPL